MGDSFKEEGTCCETQILVSDSPLGPFVLHSERPVTPSDWECLDSTLYIDTDGNPWMVFCHEWVQVSNGEIFAISSKDDSSVHAGETMKLFTASEASWTIELNSQGRNGYVADSLWMHYLPNGGHLIL